MLEEQLTAALDRISYKYSSLALALLLDKSNAVQFDRPFICKLEK